MTLTGKQLIAYIGCGVLAGILMGSYVACRLSASPVVHTVTNTVEKPVAVHDTTISTKYIAGRSQFVHDTTTAYAPIPGQFRVDTQVVTQTIVEHDTITKQAPLTAILANFQPSGAHLLEIDLRAEHDFIFGGYGGEASFGINLNKLHIANLTIFANIGYLHSAYGGLGVSGPIWSLD